MPLDRPRSFVASAVNSTSIELSWVRPATPNGEITTYVIFYAAVDSNESINTIDTMFTVQGLNEYTDYTFTVSAATRVGVGPAAEDSERTLEDGMSIYINDLLPRIHCQPRVETKNYKVLRLNIYLLCMCQQN